MEPGTDGRQRGSAGSGDQAVGELFTFGCGTLGELGHDRAEDLPCRPEAFPVSFLEACGEEVEVSSVALGNDHSLALVKGKVYRWEPWVASVEEDR
ncbi:unnamed protein product [Symbiodinium sp. CCMP2592]|nr:unnamed protein product [Symbiodinium sp. CCMP2592]